MKTTIMRIALAAVAAIVSLTVNAQDALVATLQHGDNMQAFYGGNALKQALEAAQTGDVISLSPGTFNATDITKAITIQGAGYVQDAANNRYSTTINGTTNIKLSTGEKGLTLEGIILGTVIFFNNVENMTFQKCKIGTLYADRNECKTKNCTFDQCRIKDFIPDLKSENLLLKNCIISVFRGNSEDATVLFDHCIYLQSAENRYVTATFKNSIIRNYTYYSWGISGTTSFFYNNLFDKSTISNIDNGNNNTLLSATDFKALFADGEFAYTDERSYELTAAAAQQYLGDDGTQVGIYGGDTPFTDVPSNPQITSRQIATKTDNDSKLSVKITVEAQK